MLRAATWRSVGASPGRRAKPGADLPACSRVKPSRSGGRRLWLGLFRFAEKTTWRKIGIEPRSLRGPTSHPPEVGETTCARALRAQVRTTSFAVPAPALSLSLSLWFEAPNRSAGQRAKIELLYKTMTYRKSCLARVEMPRGVAGVWHHHDTTRR